MRQSIVLIAMINALYSSRLSMKSENELRKSLMEHLEAALAITDELEESTAG